MGEDPNLYRALGPIYISSIQPLLNEEDLNEKYNIKTVISITKSDIPSKYKESPYRYTQIPVDDIESELIITEFEKVNKIIFETIYKPMKESHSEENKLQLKGDAVLIHCQSGVSRSTAFVCAYLMRRHNLSLKLALHAIRRNYPDRTFEPNDGFKLQLETYKESEWVIEPEKLRRIGGSAGNLWRAWRMKWVIPSMMNGHPLEGKSDSDISKIQERNQVKGVFDFKCAKCRTILANSKVFVPHTPPYDDTDKQMYFVKNAYKSRRVIDVQKGQNQCTHVFIEPLKWMRNKFLGIEGTENDKVVDIDDKWDENDLSSGDMEGKLDCFKCNAKVGAWSWKGGRCSCGKWLVPDIHLQRSKLIQTDENGKIILMSDPRYI